MDGNMLSTMEIMALVLAKKEWIQIDVGIDLSLDNHNLLFRTSNRCLEEAFLDCRWTRMPKTDYIHPPKAGISVHFSCFLP